jgi:hypothetical protein
MEYEIEERAAIAEYDGMLSRRDAEALALERAKLQDWHLAQLASILPIVSGDYSIPEINTLPVF